MKITPTKCKDGKKHRWENICRVEGNWAGEYQIYKWCRNCGSHTEFYEGRGKPMRCKEPDGSYYIEIPGTPKPKHNQYVNYIVEESS
jgi:hypothetical protein